MHCGDGGDGGASNLNKLFIINPQNKCFRGYTAITLAVCPSVFPCVHLCTKYKFLSKRWQEYEVTFSHSSSINKGELLQLGQYIFDTVMFFFQMEIFMGNKAITANGWHSHMVLMFFLQGAQKLLELRGLREGMFLVRTSKRDPNWHVLTMCHDQKVFNYEIRTKVWNMCTFLSFCQCDVFVSLFFSAHLSTTCSGGAIVTGHRPSVHLSVR